MLQRKIFLDKKLIKFNLWKKKCLKNLLIKSFLRNYYLQPLNRLSFTIKNNYLTRNYKFYITQNKLQCPISYSFKVPSRRLNLSRFYLVRTVNRLTISNYQK